MSAYRVSVSEEKIVRLKQKLAAADLPDELDGAAWEYGAPLADIKRLVQKWGNDFDWRAQEAKLNELPNFHRQIKVDGFDEVGVHYVHQVSDSSEAIPLLFVHGWPGSYIEVTKLLPLLKKGKNGVAFHVVAPSLPNFAWSDGIKKTGFGLKQYAEVCDQLMQSLGYNRYVTQGGDWGFYITRSMGVLFPDRCMASHINMIRAGPPKFISQPFLAMQHAFSPYNAREKKGFARTKWFHEEGHGYRVLQSTKPQTVGYGLSDSPVGLLAWLWEKLHDWVDDYPWTDDEILTWVSIYWFSTAGPAASLRIYYEATHSKTDITRERAQRWIGKVKLGVCHSPRELSVVPKTWGRTLGPVVFESEKKRGGHFAAYEIPEEIFEDLIGMFGKSGPCYHVTTEKR